MVQTLTFHTLYVFFFLISHDRRRLVHFDVTAHPTAAWVWRQMIEATPWGQHAKYLIHDRDRVYGADFVTRVAGLGIESIRTPIQAPGANATAERVVRSLRCERLAQQSVNRLPRSPWSTIILSTSSCADPL